ncbi:NsdA [Streptomyces nanshensis]|nr:NsdA [Streptomyces nanshensis]
MGALPVGEGEKLPNEQLSSWFLRSGWSKGELARQVNRRARQLGAHHISTDTSRVRRWLDGEQPREPIPRILSELFSERFGCVVAVEDLGLRPTRRSPAASGVDLPWAGPQTVAMINEFTRSDLMLGRRGFLGTSLAVSAGPALIEPMQRWLVPSPAATDAGAAGGVPGAVSVPPGPSASAVSPYDGGAAGGQVVPLPVKGGAGRRTEKLSMPEIELLEHTTVMFRQWDAQCGGGLRRKAVVGQLHEVTDLLQEKHAEPVGRRLFRVTAELAALAGWMSYDVGLQPTAQKYFVLALHAAKEAGDRPLGSYVLSNMGRQMIHLGRPDDALELIHLAQYGSREGATARTQAMLHAMEARAYANMGQPGKCRRAVRMAEDTFEDAAPADGDPDWIRFFSEAELEAETAHSYRDLAYSSGRSPTYASMARPAMERAVELFRREAEETDGGGHRRSYALNLLGMASVHLLQKEPEDCAFRAGEAIEVARTLRSERVNNRLRRTAAWAARDFGEVAEVARLGERLAAELHDTEAVAVAG